MNEASNLIGTAVESIGQTCQQTSGDFSKLNFITPQYDEPVIITKPKPPATAYGIPKRFERVTLEAIQKKGVPKQAETQYNAVAKYINNLGDHIKQGDGLVLRGTVGTMKTTLAIAIIQEAIKQGYEAYFIPVSNLMNKLMNSSLEDRAILQHKLETYHLVVLDDLGTEYEKGPAMNAIASIVNTRYNDMKSTIVTTNLGRSIKDRYVESMLDRIQSTSEFINFDGPSLR